MKRPKHRYRVLEHRTPITGWKSLGRSTTEPGLQRMIEKVKTREAIIEPLRLELDLDVR